jgi:hypothetical protein
MAIEIGSYRVYTSEEIINMPDNPQPYLVEGLIYGGGKTAIASKPKLGKSWFALKLGLSIARGEHLLGLDVKQAPVLYLEFDRRDMTKTLRQMNQGSSGNLYIAGVQGLAINEERGFQVVDQFVAEVKPGLVIIDHKSASFAGDENDGESNRHWINSLDKIAAKYGPLSYLVICQGPKRWKARDDIVDLPIGSRALSAWCDTVIALQRSGENYRRLRIASNYGEIEPITYNKEFEVIDEKGAADAVFNKAVELMKELWDKYPNARERAAKVAREVPCGIDVAWNAHKEVKLQRMEKGL